MDISDLVEVDHKRIERDSIIFSPRARGEWCLIPYPDHPNGCPNYGTIYCPPKSEDMKERMLDYKYFWLIYAFFDFKTYKERMGIGYQFNPFWTDRRIKCVIYWQNSVKAMLRNHITLNFGWISRKNSLLLGCGSGFNWNCPSMESSGIYVFATLRKNNIDFEIGKGKPLNRITMVCLVCSNQLNNAKQTSLLDF